MNFHSLLLAPIVSALANHLWQSTLFAAAAGLLALLLRKNHARVRYGLWLAASVKFLLPFSLLMAAGSHLANTWSTPAIGANPGMYAAMDQVSRPFDQMAALNTPVSAAVQAESHPQNLRLTLLMLAWLTGFLAVLGLRYTQWRGIAKVLRAAKPLTEGREIKTLRRMEQIAGLRKPIEMRLSLESLEPGIVGIFSPVLLWPEGISRHLDDAQLEAVLVHEVCHVRRRDNLTSSLHLLVEAIFWFYPLAWWLEKPLIAERERACDEEVLRLGRQPQTYAESILKVCEFCVESPLACVSGITGADLKKRIVRIMTVSLGEGLSGGRKAVLAAAAVIAVAVPILLGQANENKVGGAAAAHATRADKQTFEVASIRLEDPRNAIQGYMSTNQPRKYPTNLLVMRHTTLKSLICESFDVGCVNILGGPAWLDQQHYDLSAKVNGDAMLTEVQMRPLLKNLLEERFHLKAHLEQKVVPGYALVVAKGGPKLQPTKGDPFIGIESYFEMNFKNVSVGNFFKVVGYRQFKQPIVDKTGIQGNYDIDLKFAPDSDPPAGSPVADDPRRATLPDIFAAVQTQLGLKLVRQKVTIDTLVIDHADRVPTEN